MEFARSDIFKYVIDKTQSNADWIKANYPSTPQDTEICKFINVLEKLNDPNGPIIPYDHLKSYLNVIVQFNNEVEEWMKTHTFHV